MQIAGEQPLTNTLATEGVALLAASRFDAARMSLRAAVANGDATPGTLLNLAIAEDRTGHIRQARRLMRRVRRQHPAWDEPMLRLAESLRAAGDPTAEPAYRSVLALNPRRDEARLALAGLLLQRGQAAEARDELLRCCIATPNDPAAWDALGLALLATGEPGQALEAFIEAQRLSPRVLDYALHGVEAAAAARQTDAEHDRLESAAAADPANHVPHVALGLLLARSGQFDAAIDALEIATTLAPDERQPIAFLGGVLARTPRAREAESALRRAAEADPDNPQIANDHAAVLMRLHRHAEAHVILTALRERFPDDVSVLCNLANATVCLGWQDEAVAIASACVRRYPAASLPRRALCNTLPYRDGVTGPDLLAALRDCSDRLPREPLPALTNDRTPDRPLTIGLLSGTLKTHPVGWLTVAGLEALDPASFSIVCLVQNATPADTIARRYQAMAREWIAVDSMDDVTLAHTARDRGIDILIDLGGYGDAARMAACAHRLAPVQMKWVGMQNHSTGLAEMDWFIGDRWQVPPEQEAFYSERMLRLPDGYVCYSPPAYAPVPRPLPALANGYVTFGCFNNLAKITPRAIGVWARILRRVENARMVLKTHQLSDPATAQRLRGAFTSHGIDSSRIELQGSSPHREFLNEYNRLDIVLDPFPYSGGLTTCEALWMGVPTVTLPGNIFASRHSTSHLSNAGLTDWVARDIAEYEAIAVAKAADLPALAHLRASLRDRVRASPLCDAPRFGRNLGLALRHAWREWCSGT